MFLVSCVAHAFASVHCCLVVSCCERAVVLALVGDVYCIFVTSPCGILGQVWYLIVSFPDPCHLSCFDYSRDHIYKEHTYWMCVDRKCQGRLTTTNDQVKRETEHNLHGQNQPDLVVPMKVLVIYLGLQL